MSKWNRCWSGWFLAGLAVVAGGCQGEDANRLARLGRRAMDKVQNQAADPQGRLTGTLGSIRGGWNDVTLDTRVQRRLAWDKDLENADIRVRTVANGVIELTGNVPDLGQRQRAVWLARSTVGVNEIIDRLTMADPREGNKSP